MAADFENYDLEKLEGKDLIPHIGWRFKATSAFRIEPSFFIIGVQKGGTSSLAQYLSEHPQIIQPQRKDIYYFNNRNNYAKGHAWYKAHFALSLYQWLYEKKNRVANTITFDSTPNYFNAAGAAEKLHATYPHAKLVLMLRNPAERAWSNYRMALWHKFEYLDFEQALAVEALRQAAEKQRIQTQPDYHSFVMQRLSYHTHGLYVNYLREWLRFFPKEQIHIIRSEDMFQQPTETFTALQHFIGVEPKQRNDFAIFNKGKIEKAMPEATRKQLMDFYKPSLHELYELIGRDLNWS
jgi:hypothetical protein